MRHISEGGNLGSYNAQGVKTSYFNRDSATPNTCEKFFYREQQKQCHCNTKPTFYIGLQQCAQGLWANVAANATISHMVTNNACYTDVTLKRYIRSGTCDVFTLISASLSLY